MTHPSEIFTPYHELASRLGNLAYKIENGLTTPNSAEFDALWVLQASVALPVLANQLQAAWAAREWQPIETAPHDSLVLVATKDGVTAAYYDADASGWYELNNAPTDSWGGPLIGVTQWMPLPKPHGTVPSTAPRENASDSAS